MNETAAGEKLVGALSSGLSVLRYLCAASTPVGVSRVARDLGLHGSTCFNLLKTLVHERLIVFDDTTKTYSAGLGLVSLSKGVLAKASLANTLRPHLRELASTYRITATLWQVTDDERVVLVDLADNPAAIRVHMSVGQRLPMYIAAMGRCIAGRSKLPRAQIKRRFDAIRWDDELSFDTYMVDAREANKRGYAVDSGHYVKSVTSVSSVVWDLADRPMLAISAVGFVGQFDNKLIQTLGEALKRCADEVSNAMAGVDPGRRIAETRSPAEEAVEHLL